MNAQRPDSMDSVSVVFVHGFLSSAETWSPFLRLIENDRELNGLDVHRFEYATPLVQPHPLRRLPNLDDIADSLRAFLAHRVEPDRTIVLVTHSQGGLVAQRYLARALNDGRGKELTRIRRLIMFACPNSGAELAGIAKILGLFRKNPQLRDLEPLSEAIVETQRVVLGRAVHATEVGTDRCPVRIVAYAGQTDAVVKPASARDLFPDAWVLPGDHFSIIKPDSPGHPSYLAFRHELSAALVEPPPYTPREPESTGDQQATGTRQRPASAFPPPIGAAAEKGEVLSQLLAVVPGIADPDFRRQLFDLLPQLQWRRSDVARWDLLSLVGACDQQKHMRAWHELSAALTALVPGDPRVAELVKLLEERDELEDPV